ncbi:coiled-coil domain-containing protein 142 isoform X2 [Eublepharis macularius]|nr:coiled-coil domain-containing protein 142 isoform X2 [Eublepharis macularius]
MSRKPQALGTILPPLSTLVGPRKVAPAAEEEKGDKTDAGTSSLTALAKSVQTAEALLRQRMKPSLIRLLPLHPSKNPEDGDGEGEEALPGGLACLAQVERSFLGLSHCLWVREDPRTETFQAHVRPDAAQGTSFSYHATRTSVAHHAATLHALLQHRHHLRLSRHYTQRLKAASDFVRHLRIAERSLLLSSGRQDAGWGPLLRGLCEGLRTHAAHWNELQQHIRSDPWLRPLLLQRHAVVLHMKEAFSSLALRALCLLERCLEALLRHLARAACLHPAPLSDFFQGLEIYNQVVREQMQQPFSVVLWADLGPNSDQRGEPGGPSAFPLERVLGILAAERGQRAAQKLRLFLLGLQASCVDTAPWKGNDELWLLGVAPPASQAVEDPPSLSAELQALCREEEEHLVLVLRRLVASTASLWHHLLRRPKKDKPLECPESSGGSRSASLPTCKAVHWLDASYTETAGVLYAQYLPLLWRATAASLVHQLELHSPLAQFHAGIVTTLGQQLGHALLHACIPKEGTEELRGLLLHLLMRAALQHWDQGFCRVLGSSLTDKCTAMPSQATDAACSRTAQLLQSLFLPLAFSLRGLAAWSPGSTADSLHASVGCHSVLLSLSVAASHASCYWIMSKASQYLASGSLSQFLLVTQGDLQLLKAETSRMAALASAASSGNRTKQSPLSQQEQDLSQQIRSTVASIQHFAEDVPRLFSSECKRMSAEIFSQTMPRGKHWRLALQTDVPSSPSEYASAAAQAVLGQVLPGIQRLPHEAQEPALCQVTTAFLEAWMDHILAQKIKFSLQGALQLKRDFDLLRELLLSEESRLSPRSRQRVLSLRVFQQADNAIACLLQQPSRASLPWQTWDALHQCCSYNGVHTQGGGPGSINSLESLEGQAAQAAGAGESQAGDLLSRTQGAGAGPETYLSPPQQEWLALRLHGARRWGVPGLPCLCRAPEP